MVNVAVVRKDYDAAKRGSHVDNNCIKQTWESREKQWRLSIKSKEEDYWKNRFKGML